MDPMEINRAMEGEVLGQERFPGITPRDEELARKGRMRGWAAFLRTPTGREITFIPACRWRLEEGGFLGSRVYEDVEEFIGIVGERVAEDVLEKGAIVEVKVPAGEHLGFVGLCRTKAPVRLETDGLEMLLFEASPFARINDAIDAQIAIQESPVIRERVLEVMDPTTLRAFDTNCLVDLVNILRERLALVTREDGAAAAERIRGEAETRPTQVDPALVSMAELEWFLVRWVDGNWNEAIDFFRGELRKQAELRRQQGLPI